jgi:tetratricopeptide (TPR) repeat protein
VPGLKCASRAAAEFFADPGFAGSLDCPPLRKASQSFEKEGGGAGSVLVFEYAGAVPEFIRRVLARSLWGPGDRSKERPDEVVAEGRLLWIVSFPYGDATAEWTKARLRTKFGVRARRTRPELDDLAARVWKCCDSSDPKAGLAALDGAGAAVADWSVGAYLRGELCMISGDPAAAETAYRRAAELDATLADPLKPNLAWAARDGLGNALFEQGKYDAAAAALAKSKADGRALRLENDDTPHTAYTLACALAQLGRWPDALRELTDAVDSQPRWMKKAVADPKLEAARKRPEFRAILELDAPKPATMPPKPPAPAKPAEAISFEALLVQPAELPAGWSLVEGSQCVSTGANAFFVAPDIKQIAKHYPGMDVAEKLPQMTQPIRKACQSIVRADGTAGSVLLFEYPGDVETSIVTFMQAYVWGEDGRTIRYPEEFLTSGHFFFIFSFPFADASGEWVKARLRSRFRVPAEQTRPEWELPLARALDAAHGGDTAKALRILDARAGKFADCALAWNVRGEACYGAKDWNGAAAAYRRALDLHEAMVDPLGEYTCWACLDGLGGSLLLSRKLDDARPALVRAKTFAAEHRVKDASVSTYNLACALSLLGRFDESLAELKQAIAEKPSWKDSAKDDGDFAEARKRPDFQALLRD